jgi:hypothetical protein
VFVLATILLQFVADAPDAPCDAANEGENARTGSPSGA